MATMKDLALKIHQRTSQYTNLNSQIQDNAGNINTNISKISTIESQVQELQNKANALRGYKEYNANEAYSVGDIIEAEGLFKVIKAITAEEEHPELSDTEYFVPLTEVVDNSDEMLAISTELSTLKKMTKKIKFDTITLGGVEYPFVTKADTGYLLRIIKGTSRGYANKPNISNYTSFVRIHAYREDGKVYMPKYSYILTDTDGSKRSFGCVLTPTDESINGSEYNKQISIKQITSLDQITVPEGDIYLEMPYAVNNGGNPFSPSGYGYSSNTRTSSNPMDDVSELIITPEFLQNVVKLEIQASSSYYIWENGYELYEYDGEEEGNLIVRNICDSSNATKHVAFDDYTINP